VLHSSIDYHQQPPSSQGVSRLAQWGTALAMVLLLAATPLAQTNSGTTPRLTTADIDTDIERLQTATDLNETQRTTAQNFLQDARALVATASTYRDTATEYRALQGEAAAETERLQREIANFKDVVDDTAMRRLTVDRLEQRLTLAAAEVTGLRARLAEQDQRLTSGQTQPANLRLAIAAARERLQAAQAEVRTAEGEAPAVSSARRRLAAARQQEAEAELAMLEVEMSSLQPRMAVLAASRDLTRLQLALRERELAALQTELNSRRRSDADAILTQARTLQAELQDGNPLSQEVAERIVAISEDIATLNDQMEEVAARQFDAEQRTSEIAADFERTRQKLEIGGLRITLGQLLMEQRDSLPEIRIYEAAHRARVRELAELGLQQLAYADQRRLQPPIATLIEELNERLDPELSNNQKVRARNELRRLLERERELADRLANARSALIQALTDLDLREQQLLTQVRQLRDFLDEYLFWIPSHRTTAWHVAPGVASALTWLLTPQQWVDAGLTLARETVARPIMPLLALLALLPLAWARRRARAMLARWSDAVGQVQNDRFSATAKSMLALLFLAAPLPLVLTLIGWLLRTAPETSQFSTGLGLGLQWIAPLVLVVRWLHKLCGSDRVAAVHFGRPEPVLRAIRRQLSLLLAVTAPTIVLLVILWGHANETFMGSLGWLAFCITMLVIAGATLRLTRVARTQATLESSAGLRLIATLLGLAMPLSLIVLASLGYLYTAMRLSMNMTATYVLAIVALLLHELALRWLTITRRQLRWRQAQDRREAARARRQARIESGEDVDEPDVPADAMTIDLDVIDTKTRQLLRSSIYLLTPIGLWFVWRDVLPALTFLENVRLWDRTVTVGTEVTVAAVTLTDLLLAIVMTLAAFMLGRNLPTLLEIFMVQRTRLDPGSRYAVVALTSYFIAIVGVSLVLGVLGFSWSNIQWMAAALTVGLGFGLQEIFGNFVSGLIILFERPVRVGDTVTVGDLSGTVSKIKIRATTITDWDRKEIIVPNKELITQRVINWTLSDPVTRIKLAISVAYGCDMEKAHQVILNVVENTPLVRPEPAPRVLFVAFGDSSLNFEVQAFVSELSDRMPTIHGLNLKIYRALAANGLEIPFPQRDLHIRSLPDNFLADVKATLRKPDDDDSG